MNVDDSESVGIVVFLVVVGVVCLYGLRMVDWVVVETWIDAD